MLRLTAARVIHEGSPLGIVTVSAGIASIEADPDRKPQDVITLADQALYQAKHHQGRNRIRVAATTQDDAASMVA